MMFKHIFFFSLTILLISNCKNSNRSKEFPDAKTFTIQNAINLQGERLNASDSLGIANKVEVIYLENSSDAFAVISDITNMPPLHFINVTEDKYITSIGREGRGPGEFLEPGSIFGLENNNVLVLDNENIRLTKIDLSNEKHLSELNQAEPYILNLEFRGLPLDIFPLVNGNYATIGPIRTSLNKSFAVLDSNGKQDKLLGKIPTFNSTIPSNAHQLAWRSNATPNKDGSQFAVGFYNIDLIKLYDYKGNLLEVIRGPKFTKLNYSSKNNRLSLSEDTKRAYIDFASTPNYFYGLYSGKNINEAYNNYGKYVFVFDWSGNFIKAYKLDQFVFSISIDWENGFLYGVVPETLEPGLYKYKIDSN